MKRKNREYALVLGVAFLFSVFAFRKFIFGEGIIFMAEHLEYIKIKDFATVLTSNWDSKFQIFNWATFSKLYVFLPFLFLANIFGSYKLFQIFVIVLPFIIGFASMYLLTKFLLKKEQGRLENKYLILISLVVSFIYIVNPWIISKGRMSLSRFLYALMPLMVLKLFKIFEGEKYRTAVIFSLIFSFVVMYGSGIYMAVIFSLILGIAILSKKAAIREIYFIAVSGALAGALSIAKFAPTLYSIAVDSGSVFSNISGVTGVELNQATIFNVLSLRSMTQGTVEEFWSATYQSSQALWFIPITIFSLVYILKRKEDNSFYRTLFPVLFVFSLFMSVSSLTGVEILSKIPLLGGFIYRAFRHPHGATIILPLAVVCMAAFTLYDLKDKISNCRGQKIVFGAVILLIVVLASLSSWPIFTGDLNGYVNPSEVPEDYGKVNSIIEDSNAHTLWYPAFLGRNAVWSDQSNPWTLPYGKMSIHSSNSPSYDYMRKYFFDYYSPFPSRGIPLGGSCRKAIPQVYGNLNIENLAMKSDPNPQKLNPRIREAVHDLKGSAEVKYNGEHIDLLSLGESSEFRIVEPIVSQKGLTSESSLSSVGFDPYGMVYQNQHISQVTDSLNYEYLLADEKVDYAPFMLEESKILRFAGNSSKVGEGWVSVTAPGSPTVGSTKTAMFQRLVETELNGVWDWSFDYSGNVAVTTSKAATLEKEFSVSEGGEYVLIFRVLDSKSGGSLETEVGNQSWKLNTESSSNEFVWKTIKPVSLDEGTQNLTIRNIDGLNAVDIAAVIPLDKFKSQKKSLLEKISNKTVIHSLEAENNLYDSGNIIRGDYSNCRAIKLGKDHMQYKLDLSRGDYELALRFRGNLSVEINGKSKVVKSDSLDVRRVNQSILEKGENSIKISSNKNFNSLRFRTEKDYIEFSSKEKYPYGDESRTISGWARINNWSSKESTIFSTGEFSKLKDFSLLQISGEGAFKLNTWKADLYAETEVDEGEIFHFASVYDSKNNRISLWIDGKRVASRKVSENLNTSVSPVRIGGRWGGTDGAYLNGSIYGLKIYNQVLNISQISQETNNWLSDVEPVFNLNQKAESSPRVGFSVLDSLWVYPEKVNLLKENNGEKKNPGVYDFTRINPTKYKVEINSSEPYTLSFAEGYDPLWVAEVQTENGTETYESIPLYSVINGFQINETGKHTVIIRYRPQRWFYIGAAVSGTTLLFILSWLLWDWRRRREDEWALEVERRYVERRDDLKGRGKEKLSSAVDKVK